MSQPTGISFYENSYEKDIDYKITYLDDKQCEISSFPHQLYIPASEVTITTLFVDKEEELANYYHVTWLCGDKFLTQIFSSQAGCFEDNGFYMLTFRHQPKTLQIPAMTTGNLFRHTPRILAYRYFNKNVEVLPDPKKIKLRFHFKRVMSTVDWIWEGLGALSSYANIIPVITDTFR